MLRDIDCQEEWDETKRLGTERNETTLIGMSYNGSKRHDTTRNEAILIHSLGGPTA